VCVKIDSNDGFRLSNALKSLWVAIQNHLGQPRQCPPVLLNHHALMLWAVVTVTTIFGST